MCTELRAREDGAFLDGRSDFSLVNPLPRWWPIPDRLMAAGGALIKRLAAMAKFGNIFQKDVVPLQAHAR